MTDSPHSLDAGVGPDRGAPPGTPFWVKLCGAFVLALIVLVAVMLVFGGGTHGPVRHMPSGDARGHPSAASITTLGV